MLSVRVVIIIHLLPCETSDDGNVTGQYREISEFRSVALELTVHDKRQACRLACAVVCI